MAIATNHSDTSHAKDTAAIDAIVAGTDGVVRTKLQLVLVHENGDWWITAFHNVGVTPLPPRP